MAWITACGALMDAAAVDEKDVERVSRDADDHALRIAGQLYDLAKVGVGIPRVGRVGGPAPLGGPVAALFERFAGNGHAGSPGCEKEIEDNASHGLLPPHPRSDCARNEYMRC